MKLYFTKKELETEWLEKFPNDPDYKHNAIAGHVETKKGFIWYSYWMLCEKNTLIDKNRGSTAN